MYDKLGETDHHKADTFGPTGELVARQDLEMRLQLHSGLLHIGSGWQPSLNSRLTSSFEKVDAQDPLLEIQIESVCSGTYPGFFKLPRQFQCESGLWPGSYLDSDSPSV